MGKTEPLFDSVLYWTLTERFDRELRATNGRAPPRSRNRVGGAKKRDQRYAHPNESPRVR
jgi:hypothetical protein